MLPQMLPVWREAVGPCSGGLVSSAGPDSTGFLLGQKLTEARRGLAGHLVFRPGRGVPSVGLLSFMGHRGVSLVLD